MSNNRIKKEGVKASQYLAERDYSSDEKLRSSFCDGFKRGMEWLNRNIWNDYNTENKPISNSLCLFEFEVDSKDKTFWSQNGIKTYDVISIDGNGKSECLSNYGRDGNLSYTPIRWIYLRDLVMPII